MRELSVSQSYLICTLNERGKLPAISSEASVCLLAGGVIDLIFSNSIAIGADKKLCVTGELDEKNQHLCSLYTFIKESKPMKIDRLASEYAFSTSDKRLKLLMKDIGTSLASSGYVIAENGGFFGKTPCFIPDKKIVDHIIQNIRAELLEDGTVSDSMIALVSLMDKSKQIKKYFSKYEKDQLKKRLKEIKDSDSNKLVKEMVDYIEVLMVVIVASSSSH